jgi:hypothetical protein
LRDASGRVICGSSLCVEHLLAQTGHASVAALDRALGERTVDNPANPLHLSASPREVELVIDSSARVGLTDRRRRAPLSFLVCTGRARQGPHAAGHRPSVGQRLGSVVGSGSGGCATSIGSGVDQAF